MLWDCDCQRNIYSFGSLTRHQCSGVLLVNEREVIYKQPNPSSSLTSHQYSWSLLVNDREILYKQLNPFRSLTSDQCSGTVLVNEQAVLYKLPTLPVISTSHQCSWTVLVNERVVLYKLHTLPVISTSRQCSWTVLAIARVVLYKLHTLPVISTSRQCSWGCDCQRASSYMQALYPSVSLTSHRCSVLVLVNERVLYFYTSYLISFQFINETSVQWDFACQNERTKSYMQATQPLQYIDESPVQWDCACQRTSSSVQATNASNSSTTHQCSGMLLVNE